MKNKKQKPNRKSKFDHWRAGTCQCPPLCRISGLRLRTRPLRPVQFSLALDRPPEDVHVRGLAARRSLGRHPCLQRRGCELSRDCGPCPGLGTRPAWPRTGTLCCVLVGSPMGWGGACSHAAALSCGKRWACRGHPEAAPAGAGSWRRADSLTFQSSPPCKCKWKPPKHSERGPGRAVRPATPGTGPLPQTLAGRVR